jgi:hypothetical protein
VYSGLYSILLYGDSYSCSGIKMVSGIIHNYHTSKLVTWNNHLITFWVRVFYFPLILWRFENIGVIWSILVCSEERGLRVDSSLSRRDTLHNYHTHKLVAANKHLGTYSGYGNLLSSQFVQV